MIGKKIYRTRKKISLKWARVRNKRIVHLLHVGKTGGTFIKELLSQNTINEKRSHVILHDHSFSLSQVPIGDKFFLFLRNPSTRFVSGFYSRKRKGLPRYNNPWTEGEAKAFGLFSTPNELAEALTSTDAEIRNNAEEAMRSIDHVNTNFFKWVRSNEYFKSRLDDLLFVGTQESFEEDVYYLLNILNIPSKVYSEMSVASKHANKKVVDKKLSSVAMSNLNEWYKEDVAFYEFCKKNGFFKK